MERTSNGRWRGAIGLGFAALLAGSPGTSSAEPPPGGGRALTFAVGNLNQCEPARSETAQEERIVLACFEGLTRLDPVSGVPKPGVAESWTTSADGKTWTFKLRPVKWTKRFGTGVEAKEEVSASDFVYAWKRLLDPDLKSPSLHLLDSIPDAKVIANEGARGAALDKIANAFQDGVGKNFRTLKGEEVLALLGEESLEARRWLAPLADPAVRELLAWKDAGTPYQGVKSKKLLEVLRAEAKRSIEATTTARAHLGVDRGFFAKDEKTLVVQLEGAAPWLPSLLARAPLVAQRASWLDKKKDNAFRQGAVYCNGPYLADCDLIRSLRGDNDKNYFEIKLFKNPNYWDAGAASSDRITCMANQTIDEVLRLYDIDRVQWISSTAFSSDEYAKIFASKAPGWKPKEKADEIFAKVAVAETYEAPAGGVAFLRFRCTPPFEKADARRALASLVKPEELLKSWPLGKAPTTRRLVQPRIAGATASIRLPTFDPSKAKALYGGKPRLEGDFFKVAAGSAESNVAEAILKAIKGAIPDDAATWSGSPDDLRRAIDAGQWNVAVTVWQPSYDDPLALLSPFTTGSTEGATMWSQPTYDALVKAATDVAGFVAAPDAALKDHPAVKGPLAAASASNPASLDTLRRALLAEAESILLDEAVVVPLWTTVERGVAKPKVKGLPSAGKDRNVLDAISLPAIVVAD